MSAKSIEYIGGAGEVQNQRAWAWVSHTINL